MKTLSLYFSQTQQNVLTLQEKFSKELSSFVKNVKENPTTRSFLETAKKVAYITTLLGMSRLHPTFYGIGLGIGLFFPKEIDRISKPLTAIWQSGNASKLILITNAIYCLTLTISGTAFYMGALMASEMLERANRPLV